MNLLNLWILLQVWCHLAPVAVAEAPEPDPTPSPDPAPVPVPDPEVIPGPTELFVIPAVPLAMQWIGSIGGLLGVISFTDTYINKIISAFGGAPPGPPTPPEKHDTPWFKHFERYWRNILKTTWPKRVEVNKKGDPSWKVGIQVGLDGTGLKVG